jgi:DNA repair protein RadC
MFFNNGNKTMQEINSEASNVYDIQADDDEVIQRAITILDKRIRRGDALCSPAQTREYLRLQLAGEKAEVFCCLFLDNRNRVIEFKRMFHGTIDGASVYPREVVREAISQNAAAIIFAHNHPSGVAEPSRSDLAITERLVEALQLVEIRVLDHFIIGDGEPWSFAEHGKI